jgi:hypothetical protein
VPESIEVVPKSLLESLGGAAEASGPTKKRSTTTPKQSNAKRWYLEDVKAFIEPHGIHVLGEPKVKEDWTVYELDQCPLNSEHNRGEACLSVNIQSGIIAFKCQHDGCKGKKIDDVYNLWLPPALPTQSSTELEYDDCYVDTEKIIPGGDGTYIVKEFSPDSTKTAILKKYDLAMRLMKRLSGDLMGPYIEKMEEDSS